MRSWSKLGARVSHWSAAHVVSEAHCRLDVAVAATNAHSPATHTVSAVHVRSRIGLAAMDANSVAAQDVSALHTLSELNSCALCAAVAGVRDSHSSEAHVVSDRHRRSAVAVAGADSQDNGPQAVIPLQMRSLVLLAATNSY